MMGVYAIKNNLDGKIYIGSSVDILNRFKRHKYELIRGEHNNKYLQCAWNKYGGDNFSFELLEPVRDKNKLRERETYYIKLYDCTNKKCGYNLLNDSNIGLGVSASAEIRKKISAACKGELNGNFGRKNSPEVIKKMRDARWGVGYVKKEPKKRPRKTPEQLAESRRIQSERMKNRVVSEETRRKLSEYRKGRKFPQWVLDKFKGKRVGEKNPNSKLTKKDVGDIIKKLSSGVHYLTISKEYNICVSQVYKIKNRKCWNDKE